jgi:hypothetical protein
MEVLFEVQEALKQGSLSKADGTKFVKKIEEEVKKVENKMKETEDEAKKVKDEYDALKNDKVIYRIIVTALGATIISVLAFTFVIYLLHFIKGSPIILPELFLAMGSAAVGALAGLLVPSAKN